jgi:hypothetical protein
VDDSGKAKLYSLKEGEWYSPSQNLDV